MKPPEPFSDEWCAVAGREYNPHCKSISVPIDGIAFQIMLVALIVVKAFVKIILKYPKY